MLVVPGDWGWEPGVGVLVVGNCFKGQEADEALWEAVEAAFDFAFGLGIGGAAVGGAQGRASALELGVGVEAVGRGTMAEEGPAVGGEGRRQAVLFQGRTPVDERAPGRFFSSGPESRGWGRCPQAPEVYRFDPWLGGVQRGQRKRSQRAEAVG